MAEQDGGLYGRTPPSPPIVEMTGGGIGHLLCWERHERDGTWYAWVSLGPVHRRPGTPPPPRRERPHRVSTAPGEPGRLHERATPHTWPRRPHPAMAPRRVTGLGCLTIADERTGETRSGQRAAPGDLHAGRRNGGRERHGKDGNPAVRGHHGAGPQRHRGRSVPRWTARSRYQLGNLCRPGLSHGLTCGTGCPRVTVRDPSSPGLMAR